MGKICEEETMAEQVPFINREEELALIDKLIGEWGTLRMLCIHAPGGIGKTRLLQEVRTRYKSSKQPRLITTDIIDFDDRTLHVAENVGQRIAQMLDEETAESSMQHVFDPHIQSLIDLRKMEMAGVSVERLSQQYIYSDTLFIECFYTIAEQKRIVLCVDTTDALKETDFWDYLIRMAGQLKNTLILLAGRNAKDIGKFLQSALGEGVVRIRELPPLLEKAGEAYLLQKLQLLHTELDPESKLTKKLLLLSGGNPI